MLELLGAIGGIVLVDLVLSGDNALVIGAAAAGLRRRQRMFAIVFGGAAAILLRIAFATVATLIFSLPLLQAIGGLALIVIAVRLLMGRGETAASDAPDTERSRHAPARKGFGRALLTIVVADVTMSLDNVLAVGALAHGNIPILAAGLLLSVALLLVGSALVAELIGRLPWLLDLAALVLGWTAARMILGDERVAPILAHVPLYDVLLPITLLAVVLAADIWLRVRSAAAR